MCLTTHMKEPLIAEEDIKVYKVLLVTDYGYTAPYLQEFYYKKGSNKPTTEGHVLDPSCDGVYKEGWLHAYTSKLEAYYLSLLFFPSIIVEMYIPKGAMYFIGDEYDKLLDDYTETDEICASELVWEE